MDIAELRTSRFEAVARLARLLAARGAEALRQTRPLSLAISSRVDSAGLSEAVAFALDQVDGLAESIHFFPSDASLASAKEEEAPLVPFRATFGLRAGQVHWPEDTPDVLVAARAFEGDLRRHFRLTAGEVPAFDAIVLAPADLAEPRHADAAERLATSVYNVATGRCSVALTVASLAGARSLVAFGPAHTPDRPARSPDPVVSRAESFQWLAASLAARSA